ncbi:hypothetical protein JTB14_032795 [Gonioctena quinquepunctata]|nr:hypothetical protein JTB14_032795 [Gonioctena quinquepunctata]
MNSKLNDILSTNFEILSVSNEEILRNLSNFDPSINFDQFQEELKQNFTNLSLKEISSTLQKLVDEIQNIPGLQDVRREVTLSILHINTYDEKLLSPMKEKAKEVISIAKGLDSSLKMNSTDFSEAINKLIAEIKEAQEILRNNGTAMLKEAAEGIGDILQKQVNSYLERVVHVTSEELGQCGPLSVAINSTLISTCDRIVLPWNGFGVTLLFTILLFIPTIIVSVKLATLYQKYKQYGQYVETEYLYDAYADRGDSIPLNRLIQDEQNLNNQCFCNWEKSHWQLHTNQLFHMQFFLTICCFLCFRKPCGKRTGAKKKKKGKKQEERPQHIGGEVVAREFAGGSHPPDSRYADMAPKHWEEFPNGGPPQYQRAPTEYERPPPYYYPGTGDQ